MNKLKNNQDGFGVMELVLVSVIVILLGVVGWLVYKNHNKKPTTNSFATTTTSKTATTKTPSQPQTAYLTIQEWGVKIPLSSSVKGLSYTIKNNYSNEGTTASFRSDVLNAAGTKGCTANTIDIARGNASQFVPMEVGYSTTSYKTQYDNVKDNPSNYDPSKDYPNVKVGDYYYVVPNYRGASCVDTSNQKLLDTESGAITEIWKAINNMVAE